MSTSIRKSSGSRGQGAQRSVRLAVAALLLLTAVGCTFPPPPPPSGISTEAVPAGHGFGGGTIYYPTNATGPLPVIAVVPGFVSSQDTIRWYGPLLAPEGFAVITIDTNSGFDQPTSRRDQLFAAIDYVINESGIKGQVDASRQAVIGWSMGGGGSLEATVARPSLKASVPLAPWNTIKDFAGVTVPTLIVACQDDLIATNWDHSEWFYNSIPSSTPKAYFEIAGGDHYCVTEHNDAIAERVVNWMNHFVAGDTTVSVCPAPPASGVLSKSFSSCPY